MSLMPESDRRGRCSNCGHRYGARCSECGMEFLCGAVSEPCGREGCADRILAERYRMPSDAAAFEGRLLEEPRR